MHRARCVNNTRSDVDKREELSGDEAIAKVRALLPRFKAAMLVTIASDGGLHARPLAPAGEPVAFDYLHLRGTSKVARDVSKMQELYSPALKTWFPKGLDDPHLVLARSTDAGNLHFSR